MRKPEVDSYDYIVSVLDKAENGPVVEEREWDRQYISKKSRELLKKYDITWDKKSTMVPSDDALADRLYEAAMELATNSGVWCINTKRRMIWDRDELNAAVERAPSRLTVGAGKDAHTLISRKPDSEGNVTILGGAYGTPIEEEYFQQMVQAYAQEPLVDIVEPPSLVTAYGSMVRSASPWEAVCARREAELGMEALKLAGRPDMCIGAAATSGTDIIEVAGTSYGMWRQTDWHHTSFISENKVTYADLTRAVHFANTGSIAHAFCDPIFGGYLGGHEGVALGNTAGYILLRAALFGDTMNSGPAHAHAAADTHPDLLASQALAIQAISRNTPMFSSAHIRPAAGPCEKDLLYEVAALCIAAVTSGAAFLKSIQTATGRNQGHTTPLEVRFTAQVAHAVEGMSRKDGDVIVRKLVEKYRDGQAQQKVGKHFAEAYNLETLQPSDEWQRIYDEACQEFKDWFGLDL